jgi:hypothetical protein
MVDATVEYSTVGLAATICCVSLLIFFFSEVISAFNAATSSLSSDTIVLFAVMAHAKQVKLGDTIAKWLCGTPAQ